MKATLSALVSAVFLVGMGAAAHAATFNLANENTGRQWVLNEHSDGISMEVRGLNRHGNRTTLYESNWWGVSVGDHYQDDGESTVLSFSENVSLSGLAARFADYGDRYRVYGWDMATSSWDYISGGRLSGNGGSYAVDSVSFDSDYVSRHFKISTLWGTEFKLTEISVDRMSEVPLPAGAVLLISGLGLLGLRRRKG